MTQENQRESVKVLQECVDLQLRKSKDYQSETSTIKQADHYRRGIDTIHDMIHQKLLRAESLLAKVKAGVEVEFESLEDTYKDLINYASFAVSWSRKKMEGQKLDRNLFNDPISPTLTSSPTASTTSITTKVATSYPMPNSASDVPYTVKSVGVGSIEANTSAVFQFHNDSPSGSIVDTNLNGLADPRKSDK